MRVLRRFAVVGLLATALDLSILLLLAGVGDWGAAAADAVAVTTATAFSIVLHRSVTLRGEPAHRWYHDPGRVLLGYVAGAALDVAVVAGLDAAAGGDLSIWGLVGVKAVAVGVGSLARAAAYRRGMVRLVRADQQAPVDRPPAPGRRRLSVVVPAYMEEGRIGATVGALRSSLAEVGADGGVEIVVVDDGSADATAEEARAAGADLVVSQPQNRGKGAAVRTGVEVSSGRVVAFLDADLAYSPDQLVGLLTQVEAGWDVVTGSRRHTHTTTLVKAGRLRELGGRAINLLTTLVLLGQYRDTQCGLKAFRSDAARLVFGHARIDGFAFDVEVFHLIERYRLTLLEVPVSVQNSTRSTVHVVRDGLRLVRDLWRIRRFGRHGAYELAPGEEPIGTAG